MEVEKAGSVDDIDFAAIPFSVDKAAVQAVLPCYFVRCVVRECGAFFNVSCPGDEPMVRASDSVRIVFPHPAWPVMTMFRISVGCAGCMAYSLLENGVLSHFCSDKKVLVDN